MESSRRPSRRDKERKILIELVEYYIKTGRAVGSHALQGETILHVSAATIRNYFASLEKEGYLKQQHTSGGRIPQTKAFSVYARHCLDEVMKKSNLEHTTWYNEYNHQNSLDFELFQGFQPTEIVTYIQNIAAAVAKQTSMAVIISAPRFDHDSIIDIKYMYLDTRRVLAVVLSEFGMVHTVVLLPIISVSQELVRKAEHFARTRLCKEFIEEKLYSEMEIDIARHLYQEAIASYFVMYSSMSQEDLYKVGFSNLMSFPEFQESTYLAPVMTLFENNTLLQKLIRQTCRSEDEMTFWIGDEIKTYMQQPHYESALQVSIISVPYKVANKVVGAVCLIGPMRMIYKDVFNLMKEVGTKLSYQLTTKLIKHQISYRMPHSEQTNFVDTVQNHALIFHQKGK